MLGETTYRRAFTKRRTLEALESRLVLASETVFYDYLEDGVLKGGQIEIEIEIVAPASLSVAYGESTTVINNGPTANRIDLVFVGDGYTQSELGDYAIHVDNALAGFFAEAPLDAYSSFFNVHRVDVISNESGVDNDPTFGINRDTALDMRFFCNGTERLLCVNVGKARDAARAAPDVDQVLAVANSTKYGGAGYSGLATLSGLNFLAVELALHEFGHSFAGLADEYDYGGTPTYTGPEPARPNISTHNAAIMSDLQAKWHRWLKEPNVSTFEGAQYSRFGIYRPTANSKMRSLNQPFEQVNIEQFVLSIYKNVRPIDDATPPGSYPSDTEFFVDPVDPTTHELKVQWFLDETAIPGANETSYEASTLSLSAGSYSLTAKVVDDTNLVRDEALRDSLMTEERTWTLEAVDGVLINDSLSVAVATAYNRNDPRAQAGVFTVTATYTNTSAEQFNNMYFEIVTLTRNNVVLNADGGPGGVGSVVSVPSSDLGPDEELSPGESFVIEFEIGLQKRGQFSFFVDSLGTVL